MSEVAFNNEDLRGFAKVYFALQAALPRGTKSGARSLACAIMAYEGRYLGAGVYASQATLGELAGMCPRTVETHLGFLEAARRVRAEPLAGKTSTYELTFSGKPRPPQILRTPGLDSAEPEKVADDLGSNPEPDREKNEIKAAGEGADALLPTEVFQKLDAAASLIEGSDSSHGLAGPPTARGMVPGVGPQSDRRGRTLESSETPGDASAGQGETSRRHEPRPRVAAAPANRPLDLRDCRSPLLGPELEVALRAVPDGRGAARLLERLVKEGSIPLEHAVRAVKRTLEYHGKKGVESAVRFVQIVLPDYQHEDDLKAELEAAKQHDYVPKREPPKIVPTVRLPSDPAGVKRFLKYMPG
jgi:hypothetical protein